MRSTNHRGRRGWVSLVKSSGVDSSDCCIARARVRGGRELVSKSISSAISSSEITIPLDISGKMSSTDSNLEASALMGGDECDL